MNSHEVGIVKFNDAELVSFKDERDGSVSVALYSSVNVQSPKFKCPSTVSGNLNPSGKMQHST